MNDAIESLSEAYGRYRTHEPILAAAVAIARPGPVLELGCGTFSTPLLRAMCGAMGRRLVSVESDERFAKAWRVVHPEPGHEILDAIPLTGEPWSVVFVDHAPASARMKDVERLAESAEFLVLHDTEDPVYEWQRLGELFTFRADYRRMKPWTSVVSNVRPFPMSAL
jgi:hypothetical protein